MKALILNPYTAQSLDDFKRAPSHALLLVGPAGSGKTSLARGLAESLLGLDDLEPYPYKMVVSGRQDSIGIESIRQLESFLSLKVPRPGSINRIVIITDAHNLTLEAQNGLLKTLEEPPTGTLIILTANPVQALLPTVRSRTQLIDVKKPDRPSLEAYFRAARHDDKKIARAYAISGGLPGLMTALLEQTDHPLLEATEQARAWLRAGTYDRLLMVDTLARRRPLAVDMASILQQMARLSLQTASGSTAKRWQAILEAAYAAEEALAQSAQPKLALTNLALAF